MLAIIMPVYNEQASVRKVVTEWFHEVENWAEDFTFLAIDDGSKDETLRILQRLQEQHGPRLEIISRENRGHGQSCLQGYRMALAKGVQWILQIDSDGQCDPQYFFRFWREREKYDVIYGNRIRREDGWRRILATHILRLVVLATARAWCIDPNVPYRLMKASTLTKPLDRIRPDFYLANVALAVLLRRDTAIKQGVVPIRFRERYGGEPSVPVSTFQNRAIELICQLKNLQKN